MREERSKRWEFPRRASESTGGSVVFGPPEFSPPCGGNSKSLAIRKKPPFLSVRRETVVARRKRRASESASHPAVHLVSSTCQSVANKEPNSCRVRLFLFLFSFQRLFFALTFDFLRATPKRRKAKRSISNGTNNRSSRKRTLFSRTYHFEYIPLAC